MSRITAVLGVLLCGVLLAGCTDGGMDKVGQSQAGAGSESPPESTAPTPQPSPRMHQAVYCTSVVNGQQVLLQGYMDLVERAMDANSLATVSTDANRYAADLQATLDEMPASVVPMLQDELAVLMQVASQETPDLDRYNAAATSIETLCNKYR